MGAATVAFVVSSLNPGGAEGKLVDVVNRLDRSRFCPVVCCLHAGGALVSEIRDAPVYEGLLSHKYDGRVLCRLVSVFRREKPVILFSIGAYDAGWWGRLAALATRVPVMILSLHRTNMLNGRAAVDRLNRLLTPVTDAFVAMSERHRGYLINIEKLPRGKIVTIPNGVDTYLFHPHRDKREARRRLGLLESGALVGLVANFKPEKAHDVFVQAAALCSQTIRGATFVLVGDGPLRTRIEGWIKASGIAERFILLGMHRNMPDVYGAMDVCVLCSHNENFPNVLLEAMAAGLPVVATNVGSVPDIIVDNETGLLVPPRDAESLASALVDLLADPEGAEAMGQAGRQRVERLFTIEQMVSKREDLFEQLLRVKNQRSSFR